MQCKFLSELRDGEGPSKRFRRARTRLARFRCTAARLQLHSCTRKTRRGYTSFASCVGIGGVPASAQSSRLGQSSRSRPSRRRVPRATLARPCSRRASSRKTFLNPRTYAFSSVASTATDARRAMRALGRASSRRSSSHRLRSRVARASRARRVGAFERARHFFLFARRRASAPRRFARAARSAEAPRRASRLGCVNANRRFSDVRGFRRQWVMTSHKRST